MSLRSRIATWLRAVTKHDTFDRQVDEELEFHLESYAEDLMRSGIPRDEAMRRARAELGSLALGREKCRAAPNRVSNDSKDRGSKDHEP